MPTDPSPPPALGQCDICGALAPWTALLPLGQVDFLLPTPQGRRLAGSRPLRGCPQPWRDRPRLHQAALEAAPLHVRRPGPFHRHPCHLQWQDLSPNGAAPPQRRRQRRRRRPRASQAPGSIVFVPPRPIRP